MNRLSNQCRQSCIQNIVGCNGSDERVSGIFGQQFNPRTTPPQDWRGRPQHCDTINQEEFSPRREVRKERRVGRVA